MLTYSLDYMKVALSLKPNDYLLWNALGVIAAHPSKMKTSLCFCNKLKNVFIFNSYERIWFCSTLFF